MVKNNPKRRPRSARVEQKYVRARQEILGIAEKLLLEKGAEAVTLAAVASELGMTKQALYHYFASKEALVRQLVTTLLDSEIEALIAAVEAVDSGEEPLGTLIQTFYRHYIERLGAFRLVYCQSQLYGGDAVLDEETVRDEINPRTRHLFDVLEERLSQRGGSRRKRERMRRLAFTAWTSALGLVTMLGVADATNDPLIHTDEDLLATLSGVFDRSVRD